MNTTTIKDKKVKPEKVIPELEKVMPYVRHLIGEQVVIKFGEFSFTAKLVNVRMTKLADFVNVPEKRENEGKFYTPKSVGLFFEGGEMIALVVEDIRHASVGLNGSVFVFDSVKLQIGLHK